MKKNEYIYYKFEMNIFVWRKNSSVNYICAILYYIKKYKKILHFIE